MEEAIKLIFEGIKDGHMTLFDAEQKLLSFYDSSVKKYVELGKREVSLGEELNYPMMKL